MSVLGAFKLPTLSNEPFTIYGPGSTEREELSKVVDGLRNREAQKVQPFINGEYVKGGTVEKQASPYDHKHILVEYEQADAKLVGEAIQGALAAKRKWVQTPLHERAAIFYRAAWLIQNDYKYEMMAATMLGQGKNPYQADIDCVAESIDFLKTFPSIAEQLYHNQPPFNAAGVWNRSEQRPLDGFVYAVSPFNFTALAVNLVLAPIIVGNVVIWKPSPGAMLSSWLFNKIMIEAGLPAGVLQFVPGDAEQVTDAVLSSRDFGALHFTGSTQVFQSLWTKIGAKIGFWTSYPRLIGETSGKNFHLIHKSANVRNAALKTIRAAFEYQGQKCSACSRVYVARSIADEFLSILASETKKLTMGDKITDFSGPVISKPAFDRVSGYITEAKQDSSVEIVEGGDFDDSVGYYIVSLSLTCLCGRLSLTFAIQRPTVLKVTSPNSKFLKQEIFGPVVAVHIYEDDSFGKDLFQLIDTTSEFALSGAIFANDRNAITETTEGLRFSAGNFYIKYVNLEVALTTHVNKLTRFSDQCTDAMPGHQPFGGSRASGLLQRFISSRTIKENFGTIDDVLYCSNLK
ncbi:hypothetical protein NW762_011317 [Fusarium torreyae]|uniref:L-glutamate gamma-semialdehyde dehydrogenase n=1 Tax=Fusarium torreyae TaxID=1237075 RepID=A0A9W8VAV2_9HYPO|nr:hypothetical protein NW762_011317 [Fusarium torreyae]